MFKFRSKLAVLPGLMAASLLALSSISLGGAQGVGVSGISGQAITGVQVQNVGAAAGTVSVSLYPQNGGAAIPLAQLPLPKESAVNYYLPSEANVPSGAYSMVASSDQPIEAIVRTDWAATGGGAIYGSVDPAADVIVPLVLKNFAGQTSQFTVQAAGDNTTYRVEIYGRGNPVAVKTKLNESLSNGLSRTYNLGSATETLGQGLPNNGQDLGVATGFAGYARIVATSGTVVVQSFIDVAGSRAVTGFSGVPASSAAQTLYAPLVRANFFGDTGIQLVNPSNTAANVRITFYADAASPKKPASPVQQTIAVPANSSAIAFQGPGGNSRAAGLPGGTQTPANPTPTNDGFFGVAKIESLNNGPALLAVVNDSVLGPGFVTTSGSTYNAQTSTDAGTRFGLPLVRARHVTGSELTTGVQIQNTTGTATTVNMTVTCYNGQVKTAPGVTVGANGSGNLYQGTVQSLCPTVPANLGGAGWFGSAIITSAQPVVLLVNDANFPGAPVVLDGANYTGLKIAQ